MSYVGLNSKLGVCHTQPKTAEPKQESSENTKKKSPELMSLVSCHLPPTDQAHINKDALMRSCILGCHGTGELTDQERIDQFARRFGKEAAEVAELGIALIPVYGASIDIKDIIEQLTNMFTGKEVDQFTLYMSVIGICTELAPEVDPIIDLVKAIGKKITPEMQSLIVDAARKALKLGRFDQLKAIGSTLERMMKNFGTKLFDSECKRAKDLCEAVFFKFPAKLTGNAHSISDNIDRKVFPEMEDFYFALRKHVDDLSDAEVSEIKRLRETLFSVKPGEEMVMVKALANDINNMPSEIFSFTVRKSDLVGIKSQDDLIKRLRLDYSDSPFVNNTGDLLSDISFAEFKATSGMVDTPFHTSKFQGKINIRDKKYPYTGNGFISCEEQIIPEYFLTQFMTGFETKGFDDLLKELQ